MSDDKEQGPREPGESGSLLPDRWQELSPLVDAVLDAPTERRSSALTQVTGGNPQLRAEVERLVDECERAVPMLDRPVADGFSRLLIDVGEAAIPEIPGGRYRIEREVGRGGMARVYLARDLKHSRSVAVKVIRAEWAASLGRDRFLREIEIAAGLRHPNIVPLYDSGDADGALYFVMPYEEGPSLRTRLDRDGVLPVSESVSVLRDVARALAYAHERGVVHRDVKPDNVMLSGGAAVVTDFGIAKAVSAARNEVPERNSTQPGAIFGTPAYMAPEQAVGDPSIDHRADIYSFGCLAYELFAGRPPFHDLPLHETIAAQLGTEPTPLSDVSAAVPESVARLVARCLEKKAAARPQSAQELLAELDAGQTSPIEAAGRRRVLSRAGLVTSVIVGFALIGFFVFRGRTSSKVEEPREATVAVLPLENRGDSTQSDLAYGLTDEIATALVRVPGVRVMSKRAIADSRARRGVDTDKTGRELGADFLVIGSLTAVNDRLRVMAKLVRARDGATLWANPLEGGLGELAAMRDEIAKSVGDSLRKHLGLSANYQAGGERHACPGNEDAYRLYFLGNQALNRRGQRVKVSIERFTEATKLDPLCAEAFSGLSLALALAPYFEPRSTREVAAQVRTAAKQALQLDPTLAPPHVALGLLHQFEYAWDSAAIEFREAVRLREPDDIEPLVQYGRYMLHQGRAADALEQFLKARRTEPSSALVSSWVAITYLLRGQMDSARVESDRAFQNDSTNYTTLQHGASIRVADGDFAGARKFVNRLTSRYDRLALWVLAVTGDTAEALGRLRELESQRPLPWLAASTRAYVMLGIGDTTKAMAALDRATDAQELWPSSGSVLLDPIFAPVRSSARFQALLRRVNLPVSGATPGLGRVSR